MHIKVAREWLGSMNMAARLLMVLVACLLSATTVYGDNDRQSGKAIEVPLPESAPSAASASERQPDFQNVYEGIRDSALASQYEHAEWVAQVKISGVHRMVDNALSAPGMVAILGYVYSGVAQKVWKGEQGKLVAFRVTLEACDRKLVRGEQYLLFANTDADGRLQIASCDGIMPGADVASLLAYLQQGGQG